MVFISALIPVCMLLGFITATIFSSILLYKKDQYKIGGMLKILLLVCLVSNAATVIFLVVVIFVPRNLEPGPLVPPANIYENGGVKNITL